MSAIEDYDQGTQEGRGQGRFSDYLPWLCVRQVPSCAIRSRVYSRKFGRILHLMSNAEVLTLYRLDWDDSVIEVREQFPLHPKLTNYIAHQLNVRPAGYTFGGLVMTTDFLVTYKVGKDTIFKAYQVKDTQAALDNKRTMTKLVIEQRYWKAKGVESKVLLAENFKPVFSDNLRGLYPFRNRACNPEDLQFWNEQLLAIARRNPQLPINQLMAIDLPASPGIGLADHALNALKMLVGYKRWVFPIKSKLLLSCNLSDFRVCHVG